MITVYSETDRQEIAQALMASPLLPFVLVRRSALGGEDRASLLIAVSLDLKNSWSNGIFENSRYRRFHLINGKLETFGGYNTPKFRTCSVKSVKHAVEKILAWAATA